MYTVQISDAVKDILDRLVAEGFAGNLAEAVEQAVRGCEAELGSDQDELMAAVEAGLTDMREGHYVTIDGPESRRALWDEVRREVRAEVAKPRPKSISDET